MKYFMICVSVWRTENLKARFGSDMLSSECC